MYGGVYGNIQFAKRYPIKTDKEIDINLKIYSKLIKRISNIIKATSTISNYIFKTKIYELEFIGEFNPNDVIQIDTKNMRVLLNGENALHLIGKDNFSNIKPGNNVFIYSDNENERNIKITVRWEDRWL